MDATVMLRRVIPWLAIPVLLFIAVSCSGTATTPEGASTPGSGLSGAMTEPRGTVLGNIGIGGAMVNLLEVSGSTCDMQSPPLQSTGSQPDGAYTFSQPVPQINYCIRFSSQTYNCGCEWVNDQCVCSPPSSP